MPRKKKPVRVANQIDGLFDRLTELLGERPDSTLVTNFLNDIGIDFTDKHSIDIFMDCYSLPELGIEVKTWKGVIASLTFRMFNWARELKSFQIYSGDFACGVTSRDDRTAVKNKMNMEPKRSSETPETKDNPGTKRDVYKLPKYRISFIFNSRTNSIDLVSVSSYQFGALTNEDIEAYKNRT